MHTDIRRAYFHASSKEEKYVGQLLEMWSAGTLEYGRLRVSVIARRDAAAHLEDANAEVFWQEHPFERGLACHCSFYPRERRIRAVVRGGRFLVKWTQASAGLDGGHHQ